MNQKSRENPNAIAEIQSQPEGLKGTGASETSSLEARAPRAQEPGWQPMETAELTSALAAIHTATRDDAKEEWWSLRRWCDKRKIFHDDIQGGMRLIGIVAKEALARFKASPRSPEPRQGTDAGRSEV